MKIFLHFILISFCLFHDAHAKPLSQAYTIDYTVSESLTEKQGAHWVAKIKGVAREFARQGAVAPSADLDSLNYVLNPVIGSKIYKWAFRFNLKTQDGKILNCIGVGDSNLIKTEIGCYPAIP